MTDKLYWNPNTLVLPRGQGLFRLFQVTSRRNVLSTRPIIDLIDLMTGGAEEPAVREGFDRVNDALRMADATVFTLWDNAFNNSDFFDASLDASALQAVTYDEFRELMLETAMVSPCWPPRWDGEKRHYGDCYKGSFYEQIATESLFRRTTPTAWWTAQKFEPGLDRTRPTPYRFIEESFLDGYFRDHLGGAEVLEIGCGTGYFTSKMARHARRAVGVDYNAEYVDIARRTWPAEQYPNLDFQVGDIIDLTSGSPAFARQQFDYVILIDTFLFLFDARYQPHLYQHRDTILRNLRRLIRPGGLLLVMDPHPLWLTPWLGDPEAPFGILTEYRQRRFKVIPTLEEMTTLLCDQGFRVRRVLEPRIEEEFRALDAQRFAFMGNVPQWWFFEIEPGATPREMARSA